MLTIPVSAAVAWVVALATLPRYVRHHSDVRVAGYWHTVTLVALALTCAVPPLYETIDRVVRLPNAARWLSNTLLLLAAYMIDGFFYALAHASNTPDAPEVPEERQARRRVRLWALVPLVLVMVGMAAILWRANLHADSPAFAFPRVMPLLVVYRLLFLSYFVFVVLRFIGHARRYRRITPDTSIKLGMSLSVIGGYWALAYVAVSILIILTPDTLAVAKALTSMLDLCIVMTVTFGIIGSTFPLWGSRVGALALFTHLSAVSSYWRLRPLWRAVTTAAPAVVLPTWLTWRGALLHPTEMELLLNRRVIEILDARRALLAPVAARAAAEAIRTGHRNDVQGPTTAPSVTYAGEATTQRSFPPDSPDLVISGRPTDSNAIDRREMAKLARREARRLAMVLDEFRSIRRTGVQRDATQERSRTSARSAGVTLGEIGDAELKWDEPLYRPSTFVEQVRYLEQVAASLRWQWCQHWLRVGGERNIIRYIMCKARKKRLRGI